MYSDISRNQGVFYIAFGERYRAECVASMCSLRRYHPGLPVCVVTESPWDLEPTPEVVLIREPIRSLRAKPTYMTCAPFTQTLYLDTDTRIVRPIQQIFELLTYFDIGISFRPQFLRCDPYFLPWCNSGVIVYQNNDRVQQTFRLWLELYAATEDGRIGRVHDDRFLPLAIARGSARVIHLAAPLNFFLNEPQCTASPVRIIHSRNERDVAKAIESTSCWDANRDWESRTWIPQLRSFFPSGGLRPPGIWKKDPLIGLSILMRRANLAMGSWLENASRRLWPPP